MDAAAGPLVIATRAVVEVLSFWVGVGAMVVAGSGVGWVGRVSVFKVVLGRQ